MWNQNITKPGLFTCPKLEKYTYTYGFNTCLLEWVVYLQREQSFNVAIGF